MSQQDSSPSLVRTSTLLFSILACSALLLSTARPALAIGWNGIEPFKSRRADVERILGRPVEDAPGQAGTLRFKVAGGTVTIFFVDSRFVASRKLAPDLEGTVMQIILQHDNASDTPESLELVKNSKFERQDKDKVTVFMNLKQGVTYTFIEGKLKTTRFSADTEDYARLLKKR